jgi:hypothetical protein
MYAAPLNFDRFFKKVFSDVNIAKKFLEDFFDIVIEEIKLIPVKHKLTDASAVVEFDFRCKIDGQYVIIDMQQAYKPDVIKRFFIYHALNSGMQLETLPKKIVTALSGKKYEVKSYEGIEPVMTLIWMADDTFNLDFETLVFSLSPEQITDFIKDNELWESKDIEKICAIREKLLTLLKPNNRDLDFLAQNKLIYAFQKNIVKSKKFQKYKEWFDFAETTQNPKNTKNDFEKFKKNKTLMAVLERITVDSLNEEELAQIDEWESDFIQLAEYKEYLYGPFREEMAQKHIRDITKEVEEKVRQRVENEVRQRIENEVRQEVEKKIRREVINEVRMELVNEVRHDIEELTKEVQVNVVKKMQLEERQKVASEMLEAIAKEAEKKVILAHQQGFDTTLIATILRLPVEKVKEIIEEYNRLQEKK